MNKITLLLLLYTLSYHVGKSQPVMKQVELKAIHYQGGLYYYDGVRLHAGAYGVQVPLIAMQDDELNRRYKRFRTIRSISNTIGGLLPLAYLLYYANGGSGGRTSSSTEFWTIWGGSIGVLLIGDGIARHQLNLGIDRYNMLLLRPSSKSVGLSLEYRF